MEGPAAAAKRTGMLVSDRQQEGRVSSRNEKKSAQRITRVCNMRAEQNCYDTGWLCFIGLNLVQSGGLLKRLLLPDANGPVIFVHISLSDHR